MSFTRYGNLPGQWRDDGPSTPVRLRRSFAVVMAETIPTMRPVVSNGGNYISGGGRPPAKAMRVVDDTPREYRTSLMTGVMTNPDNGSCRGNHHRGSS